MTGTLAELENRASNALRAAPISPSRSAFEEAAAAYHGLRVEDVRDLRLSNGSYRQPTIARDWAFFQLGHAHCSTS